MPESDERYSESETKRRMEQGLRRALTTPHKPNEKFVGKSLKVAKQKRRKARKPS